MKNVLAFLKLTTRGGLLVVLPIFLLFLLFNEMLELVVGLVKIIQKDRIIPIPAGLGQVNLVLNHMGLGAWESA